MPPPRRGALAGVCRARPEGRAAALAALTLQPPQLEPEPSPRPIDAASRAIEACTAGVPVTGAGLLLLLRPLAELGCIAAAPPADLPDTLQGVGLLALRRVARPLPPAARRALLERDRPVLAVFSGADPPDLPLDTLPLPPAAAAQLDAVLAAAPPQPGWHPARCAAATAAPIRSATRRTGGSRASCCGPP